MKSLIECRSLADKPLLSVSSYSLRRHFLFYKFYKGDFIMKKRLLVVVVSLVWAFGLFFSFASCSFLSDSQLALQLSKDGKEYIVKGIGKETNMDLVIPAKYKGVPITEIDATAFWCSQLTSVKIEGNIKTIGADAFAGSSLLTSVTIGKNVTAIYSGAFSHCEKLMSVEFRDETVWYCTDDYKEFFNKKGGKKIDVRDSVSNAIMMEEDYYFYKL